MLVGAAQIPDQAELATRSCECVYDAVKLGHAGRPVLLAMCLAHVQAEEAVLAAAERAARRPLEDLVQTSGTRAI